MMLNESQVKEVERYLKKNNIENRLVFGDFLDHLCCMIEQDLDKGISFEESLKSALNYLPGSQIKTIELFTLKLLSMETSFSSRTSLLATIPFGLFGLVWALLDSGLNIPGFIGVLFLDLPAISMFALLCIGWTNNFPRWSFPAIGFCLLFSLYLMMVSIPYFSRELLGLWAWTPLLIALVICLLFRPTVEPLKKLFKKISEEPELILFALYGFSPFIVFVVCDEMHSNWMILVALLCTTILSIGLYVFLRSNRRVIRFFSIIASGVLALITSLDIIFNKVLYGSF